MKTNIFKNSFFASFLAIFCCALWGVSTPIVKLGYEHVDADHIPSLILWAGLQFAVAGIITVVFYSIIKKRFVLPKRKNLFGIAQISLLQTVLQYAFVYVGLKFTTSVKGAVLKSTDVFFIIIISSFIFKLEKLTLRKLISCIVGFLGIIIVNLKGLEFNFSPLGDGFIILAMIFYSLSVILTGIYSKDEDPLTLCGYQMAFGGLVLTVFGVIFGGSIKLFDMLPIIICLSLIYAVSYSLWTVLLKYNSASKISINSFMTPIFGVLASFVLLNEKDAVSPLNLMLALILVCVGIIMWGISDKKGEEKL